MSRNIQRRGIAAAVLILALVLGSPAHAAGLTDWGHVPGVFHQAWQWLASVLPGARTPDARPSTPAQGSWRQKAVIGTDPSTPPPVKVTADKSAGVDPNG